MNVKHEKTMIPVEYRHRRSLFSGVLVAALWLAILLSGCDTVESVSLESDIVVEAFLYAGEPVDDVHLSWSVPLDVEDPAAQPLNEAEVLLIRDGDVFTLSAAPGDSGYYHYSGDDLFVGIGEEWRIEVVYDEITITGETVVPEPPTGVILSEEEMVIPEMEMGFGRPPMGGPGQNEALTVTWENEEGAYHYVVVESRVTGDPEYIMPDFIRERFTGFRMVAEPTEANYFDLMFQNVEVYGTHEIILYRVNEEYADLYENREQDSRDLNEPPSNIEGGLGVFSAFSSVRVAFEVVKE